MQQSAMQAETSWRCSQLSVQCLPASQKPTVRRLWLPAAGNLTRRWKWRQITAGHSAAKVPSSLLVSEKTKQRREKEKTPKKSSLCLSCLEIEGRYSSAAADDINKTVLTAIISGFENTERPQSSDCFPTQQLKNNQNGKKNRKFTNYPEY